jgi:hypothetical protein
MHDGTKLDVDIPTFFLWIFFITITGSVLMGIVIWQIIVTTKINGGTEGGAKSTFVEFFNRAMKKVKILKTSLAFVITFLAVWVCIFSYRGSLYVHGPHARESFVEWATCVVKNSLYNTDDSAWEGVCGKHAKYR